MSESFRKIVRTVFNYAPYNVGMAGMWYLYASIFFLVLIYRYLFIIMKKVTRTVPILISNST